MFDSDYNTKETMLCKKSGVEPSRTILHHENCYLHVYILYWDFQKFLQTVSGLTHCMWVADPDGWKVTARGWAKQLGQAGCNALARWRSSPSSTRWNLVAAASSALSTFLWRPDLVNGACSSSSSSCSSSSFSLPRLKTSSPTLTTFNPSQSL